MKNDLWSKYGDLAVRIDDRSYRTDNLSNSPYSKGSVQAFLINEFSTPDPIQSEADLEVAILKLKQNAALIASHMKLSSAMELLHEVGLEIHKAAQR